MRCVFVIDDAEDISKVIPFSFNNTLLLKLLTITMGVYKDAF